MQMKRIYKHGHGSDDMHKQDQALFSQLLECHDQIQRKTEPLEKGIRSITTANTPELVKILQEHVAGMEKRFGMGRAIRSWDPLFAALFEYRDEIKLEYNSIENGIEALVTSEDPKLIELIKCHDQTLHSFVEKGGYASREESIKPDWLE